MKFKILIIFILLFSKGVLLGQTPVITMTTSKAIGSAFTFYLKTDTNNSQIQVDFGNGTLVGQTINSTFTQVTGSLVGSQTVKVYGTGINSLDCGLEQITALDVTQCPSLILLSCHHNLLTSLDVSKNTALEWITCNMNQLTALDISKNTSLKILSCFYNQLTSLDISKNSSLVTFECYNNRFTLATLPLKNTLNYYSYAPQYPVLIAKDINTGIDMDLSNQLLVDGNTTSYNWKTLSGDTLVAGTDYTIANGKTTFLKTKTDSVYCEMTTATFPDFKDSKVLKTTNTWISLNTRIADITYTDAEIYTKGNTLYINSPYNNQLSVFDINARLVVFKPIYLGKSSVQLQKKGVYIVKLKGSKDSLIRKVIVQ